MWISFLFFPKFTKNTMTRLARRKCLKNATNVLKSKKKIIERILKHAVVSFQNIDHYYKQTTALVATVQYFPKLSNQFKNVVLNGISILSSGYN